MIHFTCDMCGKTLLADEDDRFVVKIEVYASCDELEFSREDLERDHAEEIEDLLEDMADMDADELQDKVYRSFRYDLCAACHQAYLKDPLMRSQQVRARFGHN